MTEVALWLASPDCACAFLTRALLMETRFTEKYWRAVELAASKLASGALLPPRLGLRLRQRLRLCQQHRLRLRSSPDALLLTG